MRRLEIEEKAGLLVSTDDEQDTKEHSFSKDCPSDNFQMISKRPRTYHRRHTSITHPVFFFIFILSAFIFGCLSGVVIMLYRVSSNSEQIMNVPELIEVDSTVKSKLFHSITKNSFLHLNRSIKSEYDAAIRLEKHWQSLSTVFNHVNRVTYDVTLSKYSPTSQWSGIQLLDSNNEQELEKFACVSSDDYLTLSSLVKSGKINSNSIYYVNYGRPEDFAYLMKQNIIDWKTKGQTIIFMRRKSKIISQTEQIRQARHYRFGGLVLFDDLDDQHDEQTTTNDRQSFSQEWSRLGTEKDRRKFLDEITDDDDDDSIPVLILSYHDVQKIFSSLETLPNRWLSSPVQWHNRTKSLSLGGSFQQKKLHFATHLQEIPVHLSNIMGFIRGTINKDHFIMIGYQLGRKQQEQVINEVIRVYEKQMRTGWHPRRSIIFCGWSGLSYDRYTIRRWIADNYRSIERNLIAYIDLGNGITGNSTLNLHGSPLLQQIAERAADSTISPLIHNHVCHHRQKAQVMSHSHDHHRRHVNHQMTMNAVEDKTECETHKLLDEWVRASQNRIGENKTLSIVQMIDIDSSAALFQLKCGIPSILIEMTDEKSLSNETFYWQKSSAVLNDDIQPEVMVAFTQFLSEMIRQLIDEPLIPFNLTNYANMIDRQTTEHFRHYDKAYRSLNSYLGDSNEMIDIISDLTKTIRQIQLRIDQTPKNNYRFVQVWNEKLVDFERLFITNTDDKTYKHIFVGPAFGLTNTVVPFPSLSNLLFDIPDISQIELVDVLKLHWSKLKQHFQLIKRTLLDFDGLFSNSFN